MGRAKKLILGGENITGRHALEIGLVDHLAPEADFFSQLDTIAMDYLKACSSGLRMSKLLVNGAFDMDFDDMLERYFQLQERAMFSPDAEEAKRAYLEDREPKWQ